MWLTLPGAAMCSLPIGIFIVPRLLSNTALQVSVVPGNIVILVLIPVTAITSREAYKHCISTNGHPGVRMILTVFNFIARGLADLCIALFLLLSVMLLVSVIVNIWF
jgi:hypothetical protein